MKDLSFYLDKAEEIECDLDDLENERREMSDDMYRKFRKNILSRRRYNNARIIEIEARMD